MPTELSPGDIILFGSSQGMPIEVNKETLLVMREGDVLMVLKKSEESKEIF